MKVKKSLFELTVTFYHYWPLCYSWNSFFSLAFVISFSLDFFFYLWSPLSIFVSWFFFYLHLKCFPEFPFWVYYHFTHYPHSQDILNHDFSWWFSCICPSQTFPLSSRAYLKIPIGQGVKWRKQVADQYDHIYE